MADINYLSQHGHREELNPQSLSLFVVNIQRSAHPKRVCNGSENCPSAIQAQMSSSQAAGHMARPSTLILTGLVWGVGVKMKVDRVSMLAFWFKHNILRRKKKIVTA